MKQILNARPFLFSHTQAARRGWASQVFVAGVVLALCPGPGDAWAQTAPPPGRRAAGTSAVAPKPLSRSLSGTAKAAYDDGQKLYNAGDFAGALEQFTKAHALSRDLRLLWLIARCEHELGRYVATLATTRRIEQEGGATLTSDDRHMLDALKEKAAAYVTYLDVKSNEPGATVLVDGETIGTTPLAAPLPVDMGERRIRVVKPGFSDFARTVRIVGGDSVTLTAELQRIVLRGRLAIEAGPNDIIALDGKTVGRSRWEGTLAAGLHKLRVTAAHMTAYETPVLLREDELRRIQVTLTPKAEEASDRRWLWIGGGAALLAGAAITAAVLFRPGEPHEQGTLGSIDAR